MNQQYSLKGFPDWNAVQGIKKELQQSGIKVEYSGFAQSLDGKYSSNSFITTEAFYEVCYMLVEARKELQAERKKKSWKFWK